MDEKLKKPKHLLCYTQKLPSNRSNIRADGFGYHVMDKVRYIEKIDLNLMIILVLSK